jgi:hypothetical protein
LSWDRNHVDGVRDMSAVAAQRIALNLRATRPPRAVSLNDSSCALGHNTPLPLKRSPPASFQRLLGSPPPAHNCKNQQRRPNQNDDRPQPTDSLLDRRANPQEQKAHRRRDHAPAQSPREHTALEGGRRPLLRCQELTGPLRVLNVHQEPHTTAERDFRARPAGVIEGDHNVDAASFEYALGQFGFRTSRKGLDADERTQGRAGCLTGRASAAAPRVGRHKWNSTLTAGRRQLQARVGRLTLLCSRAVR